MQRISTCNSSNKNKVCQGKLKSKVKKKIKMFHVDNMINYCGTKEDKRFKSQGQWTVKVKKKILVSPLLSMSVEDKFLE